MISDNNHRAIGGLLDGNHKIINFLNLLLLQFRKYSDMDPIIIIFFVISPRAPFRNCYVCSSLHETSFFQQFEEGEMMLKVGIGDIMSARAVGETNLFFENRFMFLENLYRVPKIKRNLIFVSRLIEHLYSINFSMHEAFISKNIVHICLAKLENNLYVLKPNEAKTILNHKMFKTANIKNKRQIIFTNNNNYLWHLRD